MGGYARLPSADAITRIIRTFGGVTITNGYGKWADAQGDIISDDIRIVDIAMESNWENDTKLYDIASRYQQEAIQESVYVRYANGTVQLVTAQSCMESSPVNVLDGKSFDWEALQADLGRLNEPGEVVLSEADAVGEEI